MPENKIHQNFPDIVSEANLAPSVHNIQPTRWRYDPAHNVIELSLDSDRQLPVADPEGRDVLISCGAAAEGTVIALSRYGYSVREIEHDLSGQYILHLIDGAEPDRHFNAVRKRRTWRGMFKPAPAEAIIALKNQHENTAAFVQDKTDINEISKLSDTASLAFFRDRDFLKELVSWMRFFPQHANWSDDGLNADAMQLSKLEVFFASRLLRPEIFSVIDKMGLGTALISEAKNINSASAVALFFRPKNETYFDRGRALYRFWLDVTEKELHAWPMAAIPDTPEISEALKKKHNIGAKNDLVMMFSLGRVENCQTSPKSRLNVEELIINKDTP